MIGLSDNHRYFVNDEKNFFWLADTVWSAFTNATDDEWKSYLRVRKEQGFNVLQINILPQWDRSIGQEILHPFKINNERSSYIIDQPEDRYFERAYDLIKMSKEQGFNIALVLLWCSYVPGTWADKMKRTILLEKSEVARYVELMSQWFSVFEPVWIVSGDTDFDEPESILYYEIALEKIKQCDPQGLTTLHVRGRLSEIPQSLQSNVNLDFYSYQSGHNSQHQDYAYKLAEIFSSKDPIKPVINMEPCYEMMGYSRNLYGRFSRFEVRRAGWQSVLSGAHAGITYGAHGIWSWHHADDRFGEFVGEGFLTPYTWQDALHFSGADDYAYIKTVIDEYCLYDIEPYQWSNLPEQIRCARNNNLAVLYVPYAQQLALDNLPNISEVTLIDLQHRKKTPVDYIALENTCQIPMPSFAGDYLCIIKFNSPPLD